LPEPISGHEAVKRFIKSVDKGLLKVMSKMGISTYQSYCGAQIFDAVGLSRGVIDEFFFGTATSIEGAGLPEIAQETQRRHTDAFAKLLNEQSARLLTIRGLFRIRNAEEDGRAPVPLDEVEPAASIVKRFSTGAMSFGSISREAHTT